MVLITKCNAIRIRNLSVGTEDICCPYNVIDYQLYSVHRKHMYCRENPLCQINHHNIAPVKQIFIMNDHCIEINQLLNKCNELAVDLNICEIYK
jgi:hypothetical protein